MESVSMAKQQPQSSAITNELQRTHDQLKSHINVLVSKLGELVGYHEKGREDAPSQEPQNWVENAREKCEMLNEQVHRLEAAVSELSTFV